MELKADLTKDDRDYIAWGKLKSNELNPLTKAEIND
jgi:hypothetical protein